MRDGLNAFAQAHVIRENAAAAVLAQKSQPAIAFELIIAKRGTQSLRNRCVRNAVAVAQPLRKAPKRFRSVVVRNNIGQSLRDTHRGERANRQFTATRKLRIFVQFDERFEHASNTLHRQHDDAAVDVRVCNLALRQRSALHTAQHVYNQRKQRHAFPVDDDAEIQIEPFARARFQPRVPHRAFRVDAQVKEQVVETVVDIDGPARALECRHALVPEARPRHRRRVRMRQTRSNQRRPFFGRCIGSVGNPDACAHALGLRTFMRAEVITLFDTR